MGKAQHSDVNEFPSFSNERHERKDVVTGEREEKVKRCRAAAGGGTGNQRKKIEIGVRNSDFE